MSWWWRRRLPVLGAVGALAAACAFAALSHAITPVGHKPVSVSLLTTSQQQILDNGSVRARVSARRTGRYKLTVSLSGSPVTLRRALKVKRSHALVTQLPLSPSGAALVASCRAQQLTLTAARKRRRGAHSSGGKARAVNVADLDRDTAACKQTVSGGGGGGGGGGGQNGNVIPPAQPYSGAPIPTANADRCDFLDTAVCLQPFPNDYFTTADAGSATGRRVNFSLDSMPANQPLGAPAPVKHIDPTEWNRNDGFSPGSMMVTRVPGLDNPTAFQETGAVPVTDIARYADPDQPVVLINADTGKRQPIWSEIDYNPLDPAKGGDPDNPADRAKVNLIIRPAVNLDEGGHYVVALRHLKDEDGNTIQPADAFRVYRDNLITTQSEVESRRSHMENLFETLGEAGIQRSSLYLAWDFTVADRNDLTGRMLTIRDDAFSQLGDTDLADGQIDGSAPAHTIDSVDDFPPCSAGVDASCESGEDDKIARIVHGHVTVPCYMNTPGCAPDGSTFNYAPADTDPDRLPEQAGAGTPAANTANVEFECEIPRTAVDGGVKPARPSLYGHGLLGSFDEVEGGNVKSMANEHDVMECATDWYGFATTNVPNILLILQDISNFPLLADETQQGMLNFLYLGRLMVHQQGLAADSAFQVGGQSVINTQKLFYDGNSQGGILGGALTAVAPDFERAVLGVPGMNYSTLLTRSVDFEPYAEGQFTSTVCDLFPSPLDDICNLAPGDTPLGVYDNYPNKEERPLIFALMQMLWDRGEPDGYAHHMTTDPLPNTPEHKVLLHASFGDHQVANVAAEVEARTIGASVYQPALSPGRYWAPSGIFGIPAIPSFPFGGSALVYWDGGPVDAMTNPNGTATPPNEDIPPRPPAYGSDPHSYPRNDVKGRAQKSDFLKVNGKVRNYCTTANRPDPTADALVPETGTALPCFSHGWTGP